MRWNDAQNAATDEAREEWVAKLHADAQRFRFIDLHAVQIDLAVVSELGSVIVRTHRGAWYGDSLATATDSAMTDYPVNDGLRESSLTTQPRKE